MCNLLPLLAVVLLLAACGRADPPTETWTGFATSDGVERTVTLEVERRGGRLTGTYRVDAVPGDFRGEVDGGTLTADLRASDDCAYRLEGTLTETELDATYEPDACPGGTSGTWSLEKS